MKAWIAWLEALIQRHDGRVRDLAIAAGIAENKISRWRYGSLLPSPGDQIKLAAVSGSSLEAIMKLVWDADHERDQEREARHRPLPPTGRVHPASPALESKPATPSVGPRARPKPESVADKAKRRRRLAMLAGLGIGLAAFAPAQVEAGLPSGILLSRRRAA